MNSERDNSPKSKSWVWNDHRGELVKIRQDGRPASPSASSSTSRRFSAPPGQKHINRQLLQSRRIVEAEYGRLDPEDWESQPEAPVTFTHCLKVTLHLQATQTTFTKMFLDVVKLQKVQELLRGLVEYFRELFLQADLIRGIEPPAVGNKRVLELRWRERLQAVLQPLAASYGQVILGHGLNNLHHMKRGHSLQSYGKRDNEIFEWLYEAAELFVWIVFRRRDRPVIHTEVTRLFRGQVGLEYEEQQRQLQFQQGEEVVEQRKISRRRKSNTMTPLSGVVRENSGLMCRTVPPMSLTNTMSAWCDTLPPLTYVSQSEAAGGEGLWVLGARRGDLNEYLEPAVQEGDQLSILD
ncbi:protein phosphatase 1 regulatory subunit 36-like [Homarus americanus]|uniref:protein phosphatase 1 regulatory subunit 36-like n=1 Tax=Homarus americanus TaxID=6706 RepID=UPI001C4689A3|nr:protein phosphatase 1 regulatory subunit 36-like [Homarus americanus]